MKAIAPHALLGLVGLGFAASFALAHGEQAPPGSAGSGPNQAEVREFGRAGDPGKAVRTVRVDMNDTMRFMPAQITIRRGETVRFVVTNSGKLMHELVLGTMGDLRQHAEMMQKHPGMEHDEPYMVHVAPGKTGQFAWQFDRAGEFHYGCLIPGHFEAGMVGKVTVTK